MDNKKRATTLADIRAAIGRHQPLCTTTEPRAHASVALIVRDDPLRGPEVLFIQRSRHANDPWSGNLAFPGGRREPSDPTPLDTAIRETFEETGLQLTPEDGLGQLDDLSGAHVPIVVSCFLFHTDLPLTFIPNREVSQLFWTPLKSLAAPDRHGTHQVNWQGRSMSVPGIDLLGPQGPALWGITYRLTMQFLTLLDLVPSHLSQSFDTPPFQSP